MRGHNGTYSYSFYNHSGCNNMYIFAGNRSVYSYTPKQTEVKGELITPAATRQEQFPVYAERSHSYTQQRQPIFMDQEKQASQPRFTPQPQPYNAEKSKEGAVVSGKIKNKSTGSRFMKYTSEGYVNLQEDNKNAGALKWR